LNLLGLIDAVGDDKITIEKLKKALENQDLINC
jgi:hypothetical protein